MIPNPFPYQGSKRNILSFILPYIIPCDRLVEPFAGSGAVSLASLVQSKTDFVWLNDLNEPLMCLWEKIIYNPEELANEYEDLWVRQIGDEFNFYVQIRKEFNEKKKPSHLLYLLARCVKGSVRYNSNGEFNQSPDNRRKGRLPHKMREDIKTVSLILQNRAILTSLDYKDVLEQIQNTDLVYMDPPYQGVCGNRDNRYYTGIDIDEFIDALYSLNRREIPYIISYDGRTGTKEYGRILPPELGLKRIEIKAGRSSQATLLGHDHITVESLYLSKQLVVQLKIKNKN